jgi:hypothetical protein
VAALDKLAADLDPNDLHIRATRMVWLGRRP